jgi:curli biogenesis system outer membrane secretion channel CsgG
MRRSHAVIAAATFAALMLGSTVTQAQDGEDRRPTVAVMYFGNGAVGAAHQELAPLGRGIADLLITELSGNPNIRVVERDQLQRLLEEQNLSGSDRVSRESAVRMGEILGAQHMIFGGFVTDGRGTMRIDVRAVEVETSRIVHVESVRGKQDDLMTLITDLAGKLNRGLRLPEMPRAVREARLEQSRRVPFQATMLYSRALAAKDSGDESEAIQLLTRSLQQFPDYEPARRELAKLRKEMDEGL